MKSPTKRFFLTLISLASAANIALAKTPDWYQIEVVIFAQPNNPNVTELWRDTFTPDYSANPLILGFEDQPAMALNTQKESEKTIEETRVEEPQAPTEELPEKPFHSLPDTERKLTFAAQRIQNTPDLRLLNHLAWRQPVEKWAEPQPILIQTGQQFNDEFELEGTLAIRRGRYLHARSELFFSRFEEMKSVEELDWTIFSEDELEFSGFGQQEWNPSFNDIESTTQQYVRATTAKLKQSRRMRSGELHYIDHPLFGMLVQITPYKLPDPAMDIEPITMEDLPSQRPLPDSAISPNL